MKSKISKTHRVSYRKKGQVIWLFWGYRFGILLIFWVHETGPFKPYPLIVLRCLANITYVFKKY